MQQISPEDIQRSGETQQVEFKKSLSLQKEAMPQLCAMINTDAGTGIVLFGVEDDGTPVGVESGNLDTAQKSLANSVSQKFDPPVIQNIQPLECDGKLLVLLEATRPKGVPYHEYDGRAYIREGTSKRLLTVTEKQRISKMRDRDQHNGPWQCDTCNLYTGHLSSIEVTAQGPRKTYNCMCGGEFWPA